MRPPRRWARWALLSVIVLVFLFWAVPPTWWVLAECQSTCRPGEGSGVLHLRNGASVSILSQTTEANTLYVDYATRLFGKPELLCAEMREVIHALQANGALVQASELMLSPTDPSRRFRGVTWQGPVFSCCGSTGAVIKKSEGDRWILSSAGCGR